MVRAAVVLAISFAFARAAAADVVVRGRVVDRDTGESVPGATIVVTGPSGRSEAAISDEAGRYELTVPRTATAITYYYTDNTVEAKLVIAGDGEVVELAEQRISIASQHVVGCYFGPPPMIGGSRFSFDTDVGWPIARARDATAVTALVAAPTGPTIVDGARRLGAAPALQLGLLYEVEANSMRGAYDADARSRETAITTRSGSNELAATARVAYGTDGAAAEAGVGGPIVRDRAWWWTGAVVAAGLDQELAKLVYMPNSEHAARVEYVRANAIGAVPAGARAIADATVDDFVDATWTSKLADRKIELDAGATGERLSTGAFDTTRGAVRASALARTKLLGHEETRIGVEYGAGTVGDVAHRDTSAWLGENWQPLPSFSVELGARWDARSYGAARADAWQPRAMVTWDWTKEGRAGLYVAAARTSTLDDAGPAVPIANARLRDDTALGVEYELNGAWVVNVAARGHGELATWRAGADAELRHRARWLELRVTASSIDRAIAGLARATWGCREHELVAIVNGRASDVDRAIAGSIGWRRYHRHQPTTTLALEGISDRAGAIARIAVTASY